MLSWADHTVTSVHSACSATSDLCCPSTSILIQENIFTMDTAMWVKLIYAELKWAEIVCEAALISMDVYSYFCVKLCCGLDPKHVFLKTAVSIKMDQQHKWKTQQMKFCMNSFVITLYLKICMFPHLWVYYHVQVTFGNFWKRKNSRKQKKLKKYSSIHLGNCSCNSCFHIKHAALIVTYHTHISWHAVFS